jgi:hypothetical protein
MVKGVAFPAKRFGGWEGDRLYLVGRNGLVTSILSKAAGDSWKGPFFDPNNGIVHYLKRAVAGQPFKLHKEIAIDSKLFTGYVGKYQQPPEFSITVTSEGSHLFVQVTGQRRFEVFAESNRDFFLKAVDAQVTFETDAQGRATALISHQNGTDHRAKRVE